MKQIIFLFLLFWMCSCDRKMDTCIVYNLTNKTGKPMEIVVYNNTYKTSIQIQNEYFVEFVKSYRNGVEDKLDIAEIPQFVGDSVTIFYDTVSEVHYINNSVSTRHYANNTCIQADRCIYDIANFEESGDKKDCYIYTYTFTEEDFKMAK